MNTQVNLLPPTEHFSSIIELKENIQKYEETYKMNGDFDSIKLLPNTFEAIINKNGEKILFPNNKKLPYIYRGQNCDFSPTPSLYRNFQSSTSIFVERMKQVEFEIMLKEHPIVKEFFIKNKFHVDYIGLAQHYGLKTNVLDFTDNIDIAIFFAMCLFDKKTNSYSFSKHTGTNRAILYIKVIIGFKEYVSGQKINVIGLQPFVRPGLQRGYSVSLMKNEELKAVKYSFDYTSKYSEYYYNKFEQGKKIWVDDILSLKVKEFENKKTYSSDVFDLTYSRYANNDCSKHKFFNKLLKMGININKNNSIMDFDIVEKNKIITDWNNYQAKIICDSIHKRFWLEKSNEMTNRYDIRHEFRTLECIHMEHLLRIVKAGIPIDNNNSFESKVKNENPNINDMNSKWIKVPAHCVEVNSHKYLNYEDWLIK